MGAVRPSLFKRSSAPAHAILSPYSVTRIVSRQSAGAAFAAQWASRKCGCFFSRDGLFLWRPFFTIGHRHPSSIDVTELVGPCASAMPIERLLHETRFLAFKPFGTATSSRLRLLCFVMHAALLCRTLFAALRSRCALLLFDNKKLLLFRKAAPHSL